MSTSTSQSEQSMEIITPPADIGTRTLVDKAAQFVSKKGLEFETKIIDSYPTDAKFNFLRSTADPCHAYYKHKLAEYSSQNQDGATDESDIKIFHAPPDVTTTAIVETTSCLVSQFGSEFEMMVKDSNTDDARFNFLKSSEDPYNVLYKQKLDEYSLDPRNAYYQHKLAESISKYHREATPPMDIKIFHTLQMSKLEPLLTNWRFWFPNLVFLRKLSQYCLKDPDRVPKVEPYPPPQSQFSLQSQRLVLPNLLQFRLVKGMTFEELDTVKVTAQFVAWYGDDFRGFLMERVMTEPQFEFMRATDYRFSFYNEFVVAYSQVLNPPKYLKDKLRGRAAYTVIGHLLITMSEEEIS
ncbi:SWAP/Surp [Arabidopsis suecica]|uniref:SWAP/Surp n=1 Tax=Arabidopsis suecica TaxID=45249 RepID=A0A8T2EDX9_ARASU|nr:SWAP/Surp [Arabidopsis suecica]